LRRFCLTPEPFGLQSRLSSLARWFDFRCCGAKRAAKQHTRPCFGPFPKSVFRFILRRSISAGKHANLPMESAPLTS
jgi:hypothetical protein